MAVNNWIYEMSTATGGDTPFVPSDAPPVTIDHAEVREIYDGRFEVSVFWVPDATANPENFRGVGVYLEDPDISSGAQPPLNGSRPLNGSAQLSGRWNPIRENDSFVSPAVFMLDGEPAARTVRVYCLAFAHIANATLVRANKPGPTPSITVPIPAAAGQYVSGQEYAWIVKDQAVILVTDWDNPTGPIYHFNFDMTEPDDAIPLPPGMRPFGGVRIVYEYANGIRSIGPFLESKKPDTWFSPDYTPGATATIRCYFVSVDIDGRVNTIVKEWTPYVDVTVVYPPAGQASAPYITGLALSNNRFEWQPDGTLLAKADLNWTNPVSPRFGGVYFYRTGVTPPRLMGQATGNVNSLTLQLIDWPKVSQAWTIVAISVDMNGKPSDNPAAPGPSTPSVVWNLGPPALGGTGQEYAPVGGAGTVTTEQQLNSDGVVMMRHKITGWTNPTDNSFGGMSIARVYGSDFANATWWDPPKGATSFTTDWEPAPGARPFDFYFVSRDMMGHRNTILPGVTPVVSVSFTPMTGDIKASRLPSGWWDPSEFDWPAQDTGGLFTAKIIQAQKIYVGSILRVGGGTGANAPNFAGQQNGQIAVYNASNVLRAWAGEHDATGTPDNPSGHSIYGGWFAELYVGGDGPPNAPLYANVNGVVIVGGFDVSGSRYPYISIRDNTNTEVGRMGARVGQGQAGTESSIQGAWFREFAYGGTTFADWRMLARTDVSSVQGATVQMRNIDKFTIDYIANYPDANNPTNAAVHLEYGYGSFIGNVADTRYWKFPGMKIVKTGTTQGINLIDRGLVLNDSSGRLGALVIFNGNSFGSDAGPFWGSLTLYSPSSRQINVILASGDDGTNTPGHSGAAYMTLRDETGNMNFNLDPVGDLYVRGNFKTVAGLLLIDSSMTFVGQGGVATNGIVRSYNSFYVGSTQVINNASQFIGSAVNTSGDVTCAAGRVTQLYVGGTLCAQSAIWTSGLQANESVYAKDFAIWNRFAVIDNNGTFNGPGGVNTTGNVRGNQYLGGGGSTVINTSNQFVGSGGVNTSGDVTTTGAVRAGQLYIDGTLCADNAIWGSGLQANESVYAKDFGIYGVAVGVSGTFTSADGKTITVRGGIITGIA